MQWPIDYKEITGLSDDDLKGGYDVDSGDAVKQKRFKLSTLKSFILQKITDGTFVYTDGISTTTGRKSLQELPLSPIVNQADTFYTIAEVPAGYRRASANFVISGERFIYSIYASIQTRDGRTKNSSNLDILYEDFEFSSQRNSAYISDFRIISGIGGAKLQLKTGSAFANDTLRVLMFGNTGRVDTTGGWSLVQATSNNNNLLPNGAAFNTEFNAGPKRGSKRVLYTGPLAAVGVPTQIIPGEKFSDWDTLEIHVNVRSDTVTNVGSPIFVSVDSGLAFVRHYLSQDEYFTFSFDSNTSVRINDKTGLTSGNISRIIGHKS